MNEAQFQKQVVDLAHMNHFLVFHTYDSRRSTGAGFPDLVLVNPKRPPLFVELKTEKGRLSEFQKHWKKVLEAAGADYRLWRPSDWDEVQSTLNKRAVVIKPNVHEPYPEDQPPFSKESA